MYASKESRPQEAPWLLLVHSLPPQPDYLRVKVRRRLQKLGARPLKNSVYVLPNTDEALEDFQWLARDIRGEGGEATVCAVTFVDGMSDEEMETMFTDTGAAGPSRPRGATWVTREGVKVDRISSAWLIRRFIDPEARFKFVPARGYQPAAGELRFDMYSGEYTHEKDGCTFETLLDRFALEDAGLHGIAALVHDIDCKDDKFGRPEREGLARLIDGIVASHPDDAARLARGAAMLDDLYATFKK